MAQVAPVKNLPGTGRWGLPILVDASRPAARFRASASSGLDDGAGAAGGLDALARAR
jgi:hypothetical protein